MPKYLVYMVRVDSYAVEVEAEDVDQAIQNAFNSPELTNVQSWDVDHGDWQLASDLFPDQKPEDDVEEISE